MLFLEGEGLWREETVERRFWLGDGVVGREYEVEER
jgi:hypothetical protein